MMARPLHPIESPKGFLLTGFRQQQDVRVFSFKRLSAEKVWTVRTVHADLSLVRKHGIPQQDLPGLCKVVLDNHTDADLKAVVLSDEVMRKLADDRMAQQAANPTVIEKIMQDRKADS